MSAVFGRKKRGVALMVEPCPLRMGEIVISHDLSTVEEIVDRDVVIQAGEIVEQAAATIPSTVRSIPAPRHCSKPRRRSICGRSRSVLDD